MRVVLERKLGPIGVVGRDDRQPAVLAEGDLGLLLEAEQCVSKWCAFVLVVRRTLFRLM
jgi:hypothetical protein